MTPEELALKERDVIAREMQAIEDKRKNDISEMALETEERKSKRHFNGMIIMAVIGFGGATFGTLYVSGEKDKDLAGLHKKIDNLEESKCKNKLAQQRLSYVAGSCEKMMKYHRNTWAEIKVKNEIAKQYLNDK